MNAEILSRQYAFNHLVLDRNTQTLTHADSLFRPEPGGNCINWVLGHILVSRNAIMELVGAEPVLADGETAPYRRGAPPLPADGSGALELDDLLDRLRRSQEMLSERLASLSPEAFARQVEGPTGAAETVGSSLALLQFHEAYHAGQIGILRRLVGKEGALR